MIMSENKYSFVAYIDESGDTGVKPGSSEWFGLAAFIIKNDDIGYIYKLKNEICVRCGISNIHMTEMRHDDKKSFVVKEITDNIDSKCVVCLSHKKSIDNMDKLKNKDHFYEYISKFLLERITNCCYDWKLQDNKITGCGKIKIVFAKRKGMSYDSLKKYFDKLKNSPIPHDKRSDYPRIKWDMIDVNKIENMLSDDSAGLQFADVLSYSFYKCIVKNQFGMYNQNFCMFFRRRMYASDGRILFNGVSIVRKNELERQNMPYQLTNIFMTSEERSRNKKKQEKRITNPTSKLGEMAKIEKWKK